MGGGFEYFDIILFAMIAAFLVYRLGSVLGKRTGHEQQGRDPFAPPNAKEGQAAEAGNDNVVAIPPRDSEPAETEPETPLGAAITQIKVADQSFTRKGFIEGARSAFEMVITAYALGDMKTLRSLLSEEVYNNFAEAIRTRERLSQTQETTLVGVDTTEIIDAEMDGGNALVTIKVVSQQVNAIRNEAGEVIDGDASSVEQVTDIWTFSRDTRSSDPNWSLVATRSPN